MTTTLTEADVAAVAKPLAELDLLLAQRFPGEAPSRQPVHTVYGGAHLFRHDTAAKLGALARKSLAEHAPDAAALARVLGLAHAETVYARVLAKLEREPVEDLRIDFEDGYGVRADAEEDGAALAAARELATGMARATLPPFVGVRIKSLAAETRARSIRTLDLFLTALTATGGALPPGFVVTLPKVSDAAHVAALADLCDLLEPRLGMAAGALRVEVMVETPACLVDARGELTLPKLERAARGRLAAAHFGSYDYTAGCGVTANEQRMTHPACDFARHMMQVAFAGTGVRLSDGATNVLPVPIHRADALTPTQIDENRRAIHDAWKLHYDNVRDSLMRGFFQGWDLHPAQLPIRYAATYAFFLEGAKAAATRLSGFVARAAQATLAGTVFDDAATGQGLLNFFLRGVSCGALTHDEVREMTGLTGDAMASRSFLHIVRGARE